MTNLHTTIEAAIRRELLRPASRTMPVSALAGHLASAVASALLASQKAADRDLLAAVDNAIRSELRKDAPWLYFDDDNGTCDDAIIDGTANMPSLAAAVLAAIRGAGCEVAREECGDRMPATVPRSAQDARDGPEA